MRRTAAAVTVLVAVGALALGGWWLFARDTSVPGEGACDPVEPEVLALEVVAEHPHDPDAFTQGLLLAGGEMWESTGLRGESDLRRVDPDTGELLVEVPIGAELFGEGLAEGADGELVQLTWTSGQALRWDTGGAEPVEVGRFDYEGEGWGLATVGADEFAMSDGSDRITLRSTSDFSVGSLFTVARAGGDVGLLNELEWDGERLWANRYQTDEILRIELGCGVVDGVLDASSLTRRAAELSAAAGLERDFESRDVLNGIAAAGDVSGGSTMFVTGKRWPVLFEVTVTPG